jgi:hypothetical protein
MSSGYPDSVTIIARRRIYWSLFLTACACLAAFVPLFLLIPKAGSSPAFLESTGALKSFSLGAAKIPSHYLAGAGIGLCALYSALALALILFSFRKTASTEVFFFAFWVLSVGFEVMRLGAFALAAGGGTTYMQAAEARALLFARYAGYLSFFTSGLYAAGFRNEKLGATLAVILAVALGLALAMPVNTGSFAPTLEIRAGYFELNAALFYIVAAVAALSYLYAAAYKGERTYRYVALGAAALALGYRLLTSQWHPAPMLAGFALLAAGSWLFVSRLHAYYLWQ